MEGKKILTIPVSSANPFTKNIATAMKAVAKQLGFEVTEWENQARPTQWVQGVEFAINNKYSAIDMLGGVNPAVLGPQIAEAHKAGVKIFTSHLYDTIQKPDPECRSVDGRPVSQGRRTACRLGNATRPAARSTRSSSAPTRSCPPPAFVKGITDTSGQRFAGRSANTRTSTRRCRSGRPRSSQACNPR